MSRKIQNLLLVTSALLTNNSSIAGGLSSCCSDPMPADLVESFYEYSCEFHLSISGQNDATGSFMIPYHYGSARWFIDDMPGSPNLRYGYCVKPNEWNLMVQEMRLDPNVQEFPMGRDDIQGILSGHCFYFSTRGPSFDISSEVVVSGDKIKYHSGEKLRKWDMLTAPPVASHSARIQFMSRANTRIDVDILARCDLIGKI